MYIKVWHKYFAFGEQVSDSQKNHKTLTIDYANTFIILDLLTSISLQKCPKFMENIWCVLIGWLVTGKPPNRATTLSTKR